jgi:hypothetical protein
LHICKIVFGPNEVSSFWGADNDGKKTQKILAAAIFSPYLPAAFFRPAPKLSWNRFSGCGEK